VSRVNESILDAGVARAGADHVAAAALRELPEALIMVFDDDLRFVATAGQAIARHGDQGTCREGDPVRGVFPAELWSSIEPLFDSALAGETRTRELWTTDERHCLMVDVGPLVLDGAGAGAEDAEAAGGVAVVLDITARRQADAFAGQGHNGFEAVFERAPIGTGLLDRDGRWLLVNRALCEITGYTSEELIGKRFDGIMHPDDAANYREQHGLLLAGEIAAFQVERRYFDAAGETVAAMISMSLIRDRNGEPLHFIAQLQDISERKELEEHLLRLADHDPLTGLRNRTLFEHDLRLQVARSQRYGEVAGLMIIVLDTLSGDDRDVNDAALRVVSRALTRRLRESDLVARLGADAFAVLLPHIDEDGAAVVAAGLMRVIPACGIDVGREVLHPSATIGFTLIDSGTASAEQALAEADGAMHAARRARTP